ncbi:hypothetical protein R1flu_004589 [Riccia fluitans]|uniref:Uncharacterized protein n=1 Tax=Riccia fluitans TaxID=41844 RepID=A0ABD1YQR8_9MARC
MSSGSHLPNSVAIGLRVIGTTFSPQRRAARSGLDLPIGFGGHDDGRRWIQEPREGTGQFGFTVFLLIPHTPKRRCGGTLLAHSIPDWQGQIAQWGSRYY